jgi:hypothetical protein
VDPSQAKRTGCSPVTQGVRRRLGFCQGTAVRLEPKFIGLRAVLDLLVAALVRQIGDCPGAIVTVACNAPARADAITGNEKTVTQQDRLPACGDFYTVFAKRRRKREAKLLRTPRHV